MFFVQSSWCPNGLAHKRAYVQTTTRSLKRPGPFTLNFHSKLYIWLLVVEMIYKLSVCCTCKQRIEIFTNQNRTLVFDDSALALLKSLKIRPAENSKLVEYHIAFSTLFIRGFEVSQGFNL